MNKEDGSRAKDAIAGPDEKVEPGEVPVCEYTGGLVAPQTDGKPLFVFRTGDGGTVAVRVEPEDVDGMIAKIQAVTA